MSVGASGEPGVAAGARGTTPAGGHVLVPVETYRTMVELIRGWDAVDLTAPNPELLASVGRRTAAFCGSEVGSRMEEPLHAARSES